ncbi:MAG: helix-turn-helix domain-containing protein [Hyphomonas sp.]|nr:helix-turn-helix domain-containing protein [Hyphomonas sp.]
MSTQIGEKIRKLRKDCKLTLDQLAAQSESSKSYIWELENKPVARPSAEKLKRIADCLGTTVEYLLDAEGEVAKEDAADAHFYRKYRAMKPETKERLQKMLDIWGDDE